MEMNYDNAKEILKPVSWYGFHGFYEDCFEVDLLPYPRWDTVNRGYNEL